MSLVTAAQALLNGLLMGMIYVIVVLGLDLIVRGTRIINFAHGQVYMLGAYSFYFAYAIWHLNFWLALVVGAVAAMILGALSYIGIFSFVQRRFIAGGTMSFRLLTSAMSSVGLMMILQQGTLIAFGTGEMGIYSPFPQFIALGAVRLPAERLVAFGIGLLTCLGLYLFMFKTKLGKATRAVCFNAEVSALQGINTSQVYLLSFVVGCGLAGIAGGIAATIFSVTPTMGTHIIFMAMLVLVAGGLQTYKGIIVGGIILGQFLSFGYQLFGGLSYLYSFCLVFLIIVFRPGGLFGEVYD